MGTEGLLRSRELREYILDTSVHPREPQILKDLRSVTVSHPGAIMQTDSDSGQVLAMLLEMVGAKKTLEIGVFTGYSLLLTALTIPHDAKITAIDPDQDAYEIGLPFIKKAGVEHKLNFINSLAHPALDQLLEKPGEKESYDFAFVDADKPNYGKYHEKVMKLVRPGGIIVYDNTLYFGTVTVEDEDLVPAERSRASWARIKEFNKMIAADARVHICHLPCGDGLTICRRRCLISLE